MNQHWDACEHLSLVQAKSPGAGLVIHRERGSGT